MSIVTTICFIVMLLTAPHINTGLECHAGYTLLSSSQRCARYFGIHVTWSDAESRCEQENGHLVSIHSLQDWYEIESLLPLPLNSKYTELEDVWIGLNDITKEGTYVWTDGSQNNYTRWIGSQPSNDCHVCTATGSANCIRMLATYGPWNWADKQCFLNARFICTRAPIGLRVSTSSIASNQVQVPSTSNARQEIACARNCAHTDGCKYFRWSVDVGCEQSMTVLSSTEQVIWQVDTIIKN